MVEARSRKIFYFSAFILPCLVLYLLFFIVPFGRGVGISLTNWDGLTPKTPIIMEKTEFESKILSSPKLKEKDREYLLSLYSLDPSDNSYKRLSVSGMQKYKLERTVRKTGYEPERNRFVGLENYKKIFTGNVAKNFYPHTTLIQKFTKTSELPGFISEKEFKREIIRNAKSEEDSELLSSVYIYDSNKERYELDSSYDEFDALTPLWEIQELGSGRISESKMDDFIRSLKASVIEEDEEAVARLVSDFSEKNRLSAESKATVETAGKDLVKISSVKVALSRAWIIKSRNLGVIGFTLFFAVFSVIGINVLAFVLALALDTGIRGQKVLRTIFFLPNVLSMIIVALIWSMLFVQLLPAITGVEKWISDPNKTPWLLVFVAVWQGCGYYMIVYLAGLQNIPTEIIEAAKIDGATGWQRFSYITLPMMIPSLTISLFLTIANALKSFDLIYAMIGPTGYATGTVPFVMDIYFDAFSLKQAGLATAKAMVLFFVIVIITGIQLYTMKRKEIEA